MKYIVKNLTLNEVLYKYMYTGTATGYSMAFRTALLLTKRSALDGTNYKFIVLEIE